MSFVVELFVIKSRESTVPVLLPRQNVNSTMLTIDVYMCGKRGVALVDSWCLLSAKRYARYGKRWMLK